MSTKTEKPQITLLRDMIIAVSLDGAQTYQEMMCQLPYFFGNILDKNH